MGAESARRESGSMGLKDRLSVGHNRTVETPHTTMNRFKQRSDREGAVS